MAATISNSLREQLMNLHELIVRNTKPFIERDGKQYVRFDKIVLESPHPGSLMVTYHWQNVPIVHQNLTIIDPFSQILVLEGMTGEMEVRLTF